MKYFRLLSVSICLSLMAVSAFADDEKIGVYTHLTEISGGDFDAVSAALEAAIEASAFELLGRRELHTPDPHGYRATVFVLTDSAFLAAASKVEANRFLAVPLRFAVYEGAGRASVKINMANPVAAAHVYFHEAEGVDALLAMAKLLKARMVALVDAAFENVAAKEGEPLRSASDLQGYNGDGPAKVMAMFKDFESSLKAIAKVKTGDDAQSAFEQACVLFEKNIAKTKEGWRIVGAIHGDGRRLYSISRPHTEELALRIVGLARDSDADPAPGIDHAAAFPIEVLIYEEDGKIITATLGEMWRMQFYFWDAGYGAFAKHAQVPSQIFSSIKNVIKGKK